jgi:hypothetical protein
MADPQTPGAVTGYRPQHQHHIDLVNRIKAAENDLGMLYQQVEALPDVDERMLELARARLQEGFMWWVRSIFQPKSEL